MDLKTLCKQVQEAKTFGSGNWLRLGRGTLVIQQMRYNEEAFKGAHVAVDFVVEESTNDPTPKPDTKEVVLANPPRTTVGKIWKVTGKDAEMNKGFIQKFVRALTGSEEVCVGEALHALCGPEQLGRGMRIGYEASWHQTQTNKIWITSERWITRPNTDEDIKSGLAFLASL